MAITEFKGTNGRIKTECIWHAGTHDWWIGICNYCQNAVLVRDSGSHRTVVPQPIPSPTNEKIPDRIRKDLNEAKMCFSVEAYRACAVMARRAVQSTAVDKGANGDTLVEQINDLEHQGVITKDVKDWATVVRWVGNDAAHSGGDDVVKDDAGDILELAEQFLEIVYVTPALARARREKRGK